MIRTTAMASCLFALSFTTADAAQLLDLTGATPTLTIDQSHPTKLLGGEEPTWPSPMAAQPFTSSSFAISLGLPAFGASASSIASNAYFSGWNNEAEVYPNYNAAIALVAKNEWALTVSNSAIGLIANPLRPGVKSILPSNFAYRPYISGALNTYPFGQKYGYFEITARVPHGDGLWPAFWLIPVALTPTDEIDVTEILGNDTTVSYSTIHTADASWSASHPAPSFRYKASQDLSHGMHTYGVDWGPTTITFYLDRSAIETVSTPSDMHQPFFIIANLAIGTAGSWPGAADATTRFPAAYVIKAIDVWQRPQYAG